MAIIHVIPAGNLPLPPDISQQRNVAIYIRISTSRGSQPNSLDNQISMLIHYVNETPQYHLYGLYVDIGSGRGAESRKELTRLLEDCRKRRVQVIVTKSISRFGRNTLDTLNVCRELKSLGVDVYFHNEQIHMIDPNGELTLTVASALAESESYEKSMNIRWGLEKSARNPDSKIYSRVCYGYRKDSDGNLIIEDDQAAVVRQIFQMYTSGYSFQRIKTELEKQHIPAPSGGVSWAKRTIEKILRNEKYVGNSVLYKTYIAEYPSSQQIENTGQHMKLQVDDHHPAIIPAETFQEVQEALVLRSRKHSVVE